jgi:hypothetical protein
VSGPIVVIDSSEIREGKLEELKTALKELAAFVEADDPRHEDYEGLDGTVDLDDYFDVSGEQLVSGRPRRLPRGGAQLLSRRTRR